MDGLKLDAMDGRGDVSIKLGCEDGFCDDIDVGCNVGCSMGDVDGDDVNGLKLGVEVGGVAKLGCKDGSCGDNVGCTVILRSSVVGSIVISITGANDGDDEEDFNNNNS